MATLADDINRANYRRQVLRLISESDRINRAEANRIVAMLNELRREIIGFLNDYPDAPSTITHQRTLQRVELALTRFSDTATAALRSAGEAAGLRGIDMIEGTVSVAVPIITRLDTSVFTSFSADLIQNLSATARTRINLELVAVLTGTQTPFQAARKIGRNLTSANHFTSIAHRARAIMVTELGRAEAIGTQAAQEALVRRLTDANDPTPVRKRWLNAHLPDARESHLEAERRYSRDGDIGPIPIDRLFKVAGQTALFPRDPSLTAAESVHCHCRSITVVGDADPG